MNWTSWLMFSLELFFRFGPKLIQLVRDIIEALDRKRDLDNKPLSGEEKRLLANATIPRVVAKKTGSRPASERVDMLREWVLQKVRGKDWQAPEKIAAAVGLKKFYG